MVAGANNRPDATEEAPGVFVHARPFLATWGFAVAVTAAAHRVAGRTGLAGFANVPLGRARWVGMSVVGMRRGAARRYVLLVGTGLCSADSTVPGAVTICRASLCEGAGFSRLGLRLFYRLAPLHNYVLDLRRGSWSRRNDVTDPPWGTTRSAPNAC